GCERSTRCRAPARRARRRAPPKGILGAPPNASSRRCVVPQSRDAFITRAGGGVDASRPRRYGSHQIALGRLRRLERADADRLERLLEDLLRLAGGILDLGGSVDDRDEGLDDDRVELRTGVGAKLAERGLAGDR